MHADYIANLLYDNNPFIEALPPMLSGKDLIHALAVIPPYNDSDRDRSTGERLQLLSSLYEFYQPLSMTIDLYCEIYTAMQHCYGQYSIHSEAAAMLSGVEYSRGKNNGSLPSPSVISKSLNGRLSRVSYSDISHVNKDFFILAVAIVILGNQHKDIVNVDFHLTNKFHLKDYIVIDDFLIRLW